MALSKLLGTSAFRWLLAYSAVFGISAAGVIGYIYWQTNDLLTRQVLQTLDAEVTGLREQYGIGGIALLNRVIGERSQSPGNGLYYLSSPEGTKLSGNLSGFPAELPTGVEGGSFHYGRAVSGVTQTRLAVGVAIDVPGGQTLVVGRDVEDQLQFAQTVRSILLWSMGLVALLGLGGGLLASRGILSRIDAMRAATETIMAGDLSGRVQITGSDDELDRLAVSLNSMLERIEQLMSGMREVSENIAHDLRTPLNRMRMRLEAAVRESPGEAGYREVLQRTIEEADELVRTFNSMLSIARLEAGAAGELIPIDLGRLVAEAVELYEPVAEEAGLRLEMRAAEGLLVKADRQLLVQAITNLIDNAIKYGAAAGATLAPAAAVEVRVERCGEQAQVVVADHGPGIAEQDRERALKRFVRLEASRSRPGSGLGLSLVAAVARLHGGQIRLEDNSPGLRAVLALPLTPAHNALTETLALASRAGK